MADETSGDSLIQAAISAISELALMRSGADLLLLPKSSAGQAVRGEESISTHVPPLPEMVHVRRGHLTLLTPLGPFVIAPGQLLVIASGVKHGEVWEGEYDAVYVDIQGTTVHLFRQTSHPPEVVSLYLLGQTDLSYLSSSLLQEVTDRNIGYEASVHGLLEHLHTVLLRRLLRGSFLHQQWANNTRVVKAHSRLVVQRTLQYLTAHFREPIDAEDVARYMKYSLAHLNRLLLRFLGKTVSKCLRDLRMAHARDLLRNSDLSVAEIADRVGYSDPSNFRRAFKQVVGTRLKEYRTGRSTLLDMDDTISEIMSEENT